MQKDLNELLAAHIISQETADKIQAFYRNKKEISVNRLFIVFGILGSILVSLGIILIIAHNWDNLSRMTKTVFAFFPLVIGQIFCGYVIIRKSENIAWRESVSAFVFFAVGATMSLVSQIYNIPGNLSSFLMMWLLLCLPLIYILKSSITSLLYIVGITYYACETGYWNYTSESYLYWLLLLLGSFYYLKLYQKQPGSNFTTFHSYFIPLSLIIALGTIAKNMESLMFISYLSLFGLLYQISNHKIFTHQKLLNNGYKITGMLGTIVLLLTLSFSWFWEELIDEKFPIVDLMKAPEMYAGAILTILTGILMFKQKDPKLSEIQPVSFIFLIFIIIFFIGLSSLASVVLINVLVLALGILTIREGAKYDHLGILNFGLLIVTALVVCRFFDTDLSFVLRGILFVSVGFGFYLTNYWMLKKRKANE